LSTPLIETHELCKRFGSVQALNKLSFRVMPGEIYGLLGPNGAGKTTTLKLITGLIDPSSGWVKVEGFSPSENPIDVKSRIGYVAEKPILYDSLSPRDFLDFVASIRGINPAEANRVVSGLADVFDMAEYFDVSIATLSTGMKQKVALVAALLHQPSVLLMDEPLSGLDAKTSRIVKELLSLHTQRGGAVLFCTHIMEVAENLCTRIGIIYKGTLVAEGTPEELKSRAEVRSETLEEVFLRLTEGEDEVAAKIRVLGEAFFGK